MGQLAQVADHIQNPGKGKNRFSPVFLYFGRMESWGRSLGGPVDVHRAWVLFEVQLGSEWRAKAGKGTWSDLHFQICITEHMTPE